MPAVPPILPQKILERVIRIARRDGITVLAISGIFAVLSALLGEVWGSAVGVVIAGSGVFEVHGATLLTSRQSKGTQWLVGSQIYLMFAVLAYVAWRLDSFNEAELKSLIQSNSELQDLVRNSGYTLGESLKLLRSYYIAGYMILAVLTVLYQGGMALFFLKRRKAITAAIGGGAAENDQ